MATTRIMPLHTGKGRTESQAVSDIIDYVSNPQKTDNGRLVTGFACDSRVADAEFLLAKREYISTTGRVRGADDVLAYHVRQSFVPGEITPEEANRLGVEFAKRFTKGSHAFVVCTHIDKSHIHNHIIWNAVNLNCDRKFRNFWGSTRAVRRLNDTICVENGYSINFYLLFQNSRLGIIRPLYTFQVFHIQLSWAVCYATGREHQAWKTQCTQAVKTVWVQGIFSIFTSYIAHRQDYYRTNEKHCQCVLVSTFVVSLSDPIEQCRRKAGVLFRRVRRSAAIAETASDFRPVRRDRNGRG